MRGTVRSTDPKTVSAAHRAWLCCTQFARAQGLCSAAGSRTPHTCSDSAQVGNLKEICPGIELVQGDLLSDNGWDDAAKGCKFVVHMASPFFFGAHMGAARCPAAQRMTSWPLS